MLREKSYVGKGELMIVDSTKIRKKAVGAYKRARTTFKKAESELEHYHAKDLPSYERWYRKSFGPILSRVEGLKRQANELNQKLNALDDLKFKYYGDTAEAYAQWKREQEDSEDFIKSQAEQEAEANTDENDEEAKQFFEEEIKKLWENLEQEFMLHLHHMRQWIASSLRAGVTSEKVLAALIEQFCDLEDIPIEVAAQLVERHNVKKTLRRHNLLSRESAPKTAEKLKSSKEMQIKKLARELAFALHPDQCDEHDAEKLELWHQVQVAVKAKDLDALEVLYAHMKLLTGDVGPSVLVSQVMELTEMYRRSRQALRRQLGNFRKSPAWKFMTIKEAELKNIQKTVSAQLEDEEAYLRTLLQELEQEMETYRKASHFEGRAPRKYKKQAYTDDLDWLFDGSNFF